MGSRSDQVSLGKLCRVCLDMFKSLPNQRWSLDANANFHKILPPLLLSVEEKCSFCTRMLRLVQRCNNINMQQERLKLELRLTVEEPKKLPVEGGAGESTKNPRNQRDVKCNGESKSSNIRRLLCAGQKYFQKRLKKLVVYNDYWESNDIRGRLRVSAGFAESFKEFRLTTITSFEG
jgi:hypothetical protein